MRASTGIPAAALAVALSAPTRSARADDGVRELRYDTRIDVAVTTIGALWFVTSEILKADLAPDKCRWCYRAEDGSDQLNSTDREVRRHLLWNETGTAARASTVIDYGVLPLSALGLTALSAANDRAIGGFPLDALLITEATVIAGDIDQLVKFAFARERPFVHYLPRAPNAVRALTDSPSDDNLSFFSGHTTLAFAIATSTGTVATMRGYTLTPLVWATGMTMASAVGYLRIAADKHYFSDVLTAAIVGTIVGVGVPVLFHSPGSSGGAVPSPPATFSLTGGF